MKWYILLFFGVISSTFSCNRQLDPIVDPVASGSFVSLKAVSVSSSVSKAGLINGGFAPKSDVQIWMRTDYTDGSGKASEWSVPDYRVYRQQGTESVVDWQPIYGSGVAIPDNTNKPKKNYCLGFYPSEFAQGVLDQANNVLRVPIAGSLSYGEYGVTHDEKSVVNLAFPGGGDATKVYMAPGEVDYMWSKHPREVTLVDGGVSLAMKHMNAMVVFNVEFKEGYVGEKTVESLLVFNNPEMTGAPLQNGSFTMDYGAWVPTKGSSVSYGRTMKGFAEGVSYGMFVLPAQFGNSEIKIMMGAGGKTYDMVMRKGEWKSGVATSYTIEVYSYGAILSPTTQLSDWTYLPNKTGWLPSGTDFANDFSIRIYDIAPLEGTPVSARLILSGREFTFPSMATGAYNNKYYSSFGPLHFTGDDVLDEYPFRVSQIDLLDAGGKVVFSTQYAQDIRFTGPFMLTVNGQDLDVPLRFSWTQSAPGVDIPVVGAVYKTVLSSNSFWTIDPASVVGCTVAPMSGPKGVDQELTITAQTNLGAARTVKFDATTSSPVTGITQKRLAWSGSQLPFEILMSLTPTDPGEQIPVIGKTYTVKLSTNTSWQVDAAASQNCTVLPSSGVAGANQTLQISVGVRTVGEKADRPVVLTLSTTHGVPGFTEKQVQWSGMQLGEAAWLTTTPVASTPIDGTGAAYPVVVRSNMAWKMVGTPENCTVDITTGVKGNTNIVITTTDNVTGADRPVSVRFTTVGGVPEVETQWGGTQGQKPIVP